MMVMLRPARSGASDDSAKTCWSVIATPSRLRVPAMARQLLMTGRLFKTQTGLSFLQIMTRPDALPAYVKAALTGSPSGPPSRLRVQV